MNCLQSTAHVMGDKSVVFWWHSYFQLNQYIWITNPEPNWNSVKITEYDKHPRKGGEHNGQNVVVMITKMRTIISINQCEMNNGNVSSQKFRQKISIAKIHEHFLLYFLWRSKWSICFYYLMGFILELIGKHWLDLYLSQLPDLGRSPLFVFQSIYLAYSEVWWHCWVGSKACLPWYYFF